MNADQKHPCYHPDAANRYARIHLPVASACNIQCHYCSRRCDCVNESRPGVTSAVLTPAAALDYLCQVHTWAPNLSVVGIAGPGDPMANAEATLETLARVRSVFPDLIFCLSTNGLCLYDRIERLLELRVTHVTVTVNTIDPDIGSRIYAWVDYHGRRLTGREAAAVLLFEQERSISELVRRGVTVKVNSILIPDINDHHLSAVAARMKILGVKTINCIPLLAVPESEFTRTGHPVPNASLLAQVKKEIAMHLPVMAHCRRCRADAAGLLGHDDPKIASELRRIACSSSC